MATIEELVRAEDEAVEEPDYSTFDQSAFDFLREVSPDSKPVLTGEFTYVRPMRAVIEFLDNPHGSVKLYQGDTCVVGSFYGPSDVRISKELPHRAAVDVVYRPKITGVSKAGQEMGIDPQIEERALENIVASVLETSIFLQDDPGAGFNFILQEFENDGCLLSTCLNAAFIAALDGSCSLRSMLAAVTILITKNGTLVVDPSANQLKQEHEGKVTYVFTNDNQILYAYLQGRAKNNILELCMKSARLAVTEIFNFYNTLVKRKYLK